MLFVGQEEALLKITRAALEARCCLVVILRDLEQLLEEDNYKLDHLLVFL